MLQLYRRLGEDQRRTVLAFMEFLEGRGQPEPGPSARCVEPETLPRPSQESVIKAIKRLRATYPMLDQSKLLDETSRHVTEHLLHGKAATEVIDALELLFLSHYEIYRKAFDDGSPHDSGR